MIAKYLLGSLLITLSLSADSCHILGAKNQALSDNIKTENSIIWKYDKNTWSVSPPKKKLNLSSLECSEKDYILVNNNTISYTTPPYPKDFYKIKKGWNYLHSHKDGIDVEATFKAKKEIEFVYVYDKLTKAWAGYSSNEKIAQSMDSTRIIKLEDLEPKIGFYVYSKKDTKINIQTKEINLVCKKQMEKTNFSSLLNSGINNAYTFNNDRTIGIKSRYTLHYKRGIYSDSRVLLIYPNIKIKSKKLLKYGPAKPKTALRYAKEYEGKAFYIYSYKDEKCFMGKFPSKMIPPFGSLKEIK